MNFIKNLSYLDSFSDKISHYHLKAAQQTFLQAQAIDDSVCSRWFSFVYYFISKT